MPDEKEKAGAAGEDSYSAKTHLHQPVVAPETATVAATALPANAPEGALPSEVRPEIVTYEKLVEAIKASGKAYNMEMIDKAYNMANDAHKGVCRRSGEPYICHPLAVARLVLDLGMDTESIAAALLHDVVEDTPTTLEDLTAAFGEDRSITLCRELTKLHEEIWKTTLGEAVAHYAANEPRGEYVLVMAGAPASAEPEAELTLEQAAQRALELTGQGFGPTAAAKAAAQGTPYSKSEVYKQLLVLQQGQQTAE